MPDRQKLSGESPLKESASFFGLAGPLFLAHTNPPWIHTRTQIQKLNFLQSASGQELARVNWCERFAVSFAGFNFVQKVLFRLRIRLKVQNVADKAVGCRRGALVARHY